MSQKAFAQLTVTLYIQYIYSIYPSVHKQLCERLSRDGLYYAAIYIRKVNSHPKGRYEMVPGSHGWNPLSSTELGPGTLWAPGEQGKMSDIY